MQSAELFSGCGGLALGMSRAGFQHMLMAEYDLDAVATTLHNKNLGLKHINHWPIVGQQDVREINWAPHKGSLSVISGGPPCQPFAIGGKKHGHHDERDMWPEAIRAVREARPKAFLFENVRNLMGPRFKSYLDWIIAHLRHPNALRLSDETHAEHLIRLRSKTRPAYEALPQLVNATDYGAPQVRFRVIIFGLESVLGRPIEMTPTHSRERLLWDQYITGDYWSRHGMKKLITPTETRDKAIVAKLQKLDRAPKEYAWVTVRDALINLGEPNGRKNHVFQSGAKRYPGHTGSLLDLPAKALKAGDHGVPGGENMMVCDDGSVRYFTVREAARLVGLPDDYEFPRSWSESMRQLGNAVPSQLSEAAASWISGFLHNPPKKRT